MPAVEFLNSKTMLTKILLTHTTKLNIAFKLTLAITPKLTKVHIKETARTNFLTARWNSVREVSRVKSVFINDSVVLYHSVRKPGFVYKFNRRTVYVVASCLWRAENGSSY